MRDPEFEASLTEAKLYPQLWRIFAGVGLALMLWLGTVLVIFAIAGAYVSNGRGPLAAMAYLNNLQNPVFADQIFLILATFIGLFVGAVVATSALHFRGPDSLFGPWSMWRRGFLTALAVMVPIYGLLLAIGFYFEAPAPNLDMSLWLMFLPLTAVLIFIQTGAEEAFFRGYLQQQLAARFQARWVWMWIPAVIFAALHWSPLAGGNWPLVVLAALTFGLIAADLTERTGSLGAAMGFHFGNNFIGLALVASSETMSGLALFAQDGNIGVTGQASLGLAASILTMLLTWGIMVRVLDR